MFTGQNALIVNGVNIGQFATQIDYQFPKLWGNDSGRTLSGKMVASLVGIFPKITVTFGRLTKAQLESITSILDSAFQTVRYYDPYKKDFITITTYTSDWNVVNKRILKNESFSISFIATERRA